MKRLLTLAAASVVLLSGCAIAEQAREMTPEEKAAAVQIAEVAGFSDPNFVSEKRDLFGGNYQEYLSFSAPSETGNPHSPLVEQYRGILEVYPNARTYQEAGGKIISCWEAPGPPSGAAATAVITICGFTLVLEVDSNGDAQALSVSVTATSEATSRITVQPYYPGENALFPAPAVVPVPPSNGTVVE